MRETSKPKPGSRPLGPPPASSGDTSFTRPTSKEERARERLWVELREAVIKVNILLDILIEEHTEKR